MQIRSAARRSATYLFCRMRGSKGFALRGWEPINKRFAAYQFDGAVPSTSVGVVKDRNWTFTGKGTLVLTRTSPLEFALKGTEDGAAFEGTYTTKPGDVE